MSEPTFLKRFFTNSRIADSFSGGRQDEKSRRPGARALLAAGVTSLLLMAGTASTAWAQDDVMPDAGKGAAIAGEATTDDVRLSSPLAGWINLVRDNCDSVTGPGQAEADATDPSWSDGLFAKLGQSELGAALQKFAADEAIMVCNNPAAGMVQWGSVGPSTVISSSPEYTAHPMFGPIGDGGSMYTIGLQLRLKQQEKAGIGGPSPQMHPADALLVNRLTRMDAALYMAETAVDLKYNHDDGELYDAIRLMSRFEGHAVMSAAMISALEEKAKEFQPENVQPGEGDAPATLTGIDLTDGLRRAALDKAAGDGLAERFDGAVLGGYEQYLELPPAALQQAPPLSVSVSNAELEMIGRRPGSEPGRSYLSGGHDLRSQYYLKATSVNNAMRLADVMLRLNGYQPPAKGMPHTYEDAPKQFKVKNRTL